METAGDTREYARIDRRAADADFAALVAEGLGFSGGRLLDLGAGPCGIPVEICRRVKGAKVTAVELSPAMMALAARKVGAAGLSRRIKLLRADARTTGLPAGSFDFIACNNFIHHLADPAPVFREMARLLRPGGGLLLRDLLRPRTPAELGARMRKCYGDTPRQKELLRNSMRASLRLAEVRACLKGTGLERARLRRSGERHWELSLPVSAPRA